MKRWLVAITALSLLLLILLPACGGGGNNSTTLPPTTATATETITPTAVVTPTPTATVTAVVTPSPTSAGSPVKIGVIQPWSGPMATSGGMVDQTTAVIQMQLKSMGGILGGREVEFVRGDDQGLVAQDVAQANKLILNDKVTVLTMGGLGAPQFTATAGVAEELKTPYVGLGYVYGVEAMKYSACLLSADTFITRLANFVSDVLKAKTIAWLAIDDESAHSQLDGVDMVTGRVEGARARWEAKGINIVYEQYCPQDTSDYSPYLTKIKYLNPDVLVVWTNNVAQNITINKQISELGGWGNIKYFACTEPGGDKNAAKQPSAVGTYVSVIWLPGSTEPGMKAFEDAFMAKYNQAPNSNYSYYYNDLWSAIKAIQLAGTDDREAVAQALRSGNVNWDSAWGPFKIGTDGIGQLSMMVAEIQAGGKLVEVWP